MLSPAFMAYSAGLSGVLHAAPNGKCLASHMTHILIMYNVHLKLVVPVMYGKLGNMKSRIESH